MSATSSANAGSHAVNRSIQAVAQRYCVDCKGNFDELSKITQVYNNLHTLVATAHISRRHLAIAEKNLQVYSECFLHAYAKKTWVLLRQKYAKYEGTGTLLLVHVLFFAVARFDFCNMQLYEYSFLSVTCEKTALRFNSIKHHRLSLRTAVSSCSNSGLKAS